MSTAQPAEGAPVVPRASSVVPQAATKTAMVNALATATGSGIASSIFYPVDLIRTRIQASVSGQEGDFGYLSLTDGLGKIVAVDGVLGLWNGLVPTMIRSIMFDSTNAFWTFKLTPFAARWTGLPAGPALTLLTRMMGGVINMTQNLPLETIAVRNQANPQHSLLANTRLIFKEKGLAGFWSGYPMSVVLSINPALTFMLFDLFSRFGFGSDNNTGCNTNADEDEDAAQKMLRYARSMLKTFIRGFVAKTIAISIVYPIIRVKVLMQAGSQLSMLEVARQVLGSEGVPGFYKGLSTQLSKSALSSALLLLIQEETKKFWTKHL